ANPVQILAKCHRCERDRRGKSNRSGTEPRHESERGMIDLRQKMVFPAGTRQRRAEFAITKCAAKRGGSAYHPKHQKRKSRLNVRQLKTKARENAGPNNVGDNDRSRGDEADGASRCW